MSSHKDYLEEAVAAEISADETAMTAEEAQSHLDNLDEWELIRVNGYAVTRTFEMPTTDKAIEFTHRLNKLASEMHHIPDIRILGQHVQVTCYTDALEGLHRNDFIMAAHANDLYDRWDIITGERDKVTEASDESFPASDPPGY